MAYITGSDTNAGIKQGTTYGTAVAVGTGNKGIFESLSDSRSVTIGESNGIGSGRSMDSTADALGTEHSISLEQQVRYDDGILPVILACFFGTSTASPAEQNVGEGDYLHVISWVATANKFWTFAEAVSTTETFEFPSCYATSITIDTGETPGYLTASVEALANNKVIDSATNTVASLASATALGNSIVAHQTTDYFWINAQAGDALDSGDAICVNGISMTFDRPRSISNGFGCTKVLVDDKLTVTLTLNFDRLEDLTHFTAHHAGTEFKAKFSIEGNQIEAGDNESYSFYFPRLKAVESPEYAVSDAGANGYSVTYKALVATANPTGMSSLYPYIEIVNDNATALIA